MWRVNLGGWFAPFLFRPYLINEAVSPQPPYAQLHPLPFQSFYLSFLSPSLCFIVSTPSPAKFSLSSLMPPSDLLHCHPRSLMEPWPRSDVLRARMEGLAKKRLLCARTTVNEWIIPGGEDVPSPPDGYVISFIPFHERGFTTPPHRFLRGLLHYYGLEL